MNQIQFPLRSRDSRRRLLLKSMKDIDRFAQLHHIYCPKRPARIIGTNLPNRFGKTAQHLRAFVLLADLRLIERETEPLPNRRRKISEPVKRINEPNQLASLGFFRHSTHCMPKLAYPDGRDL